jgi:hypothetical protein
MVNLIGDCSNGWLAYLSGVQFHSLHCFLFGSIEAVQAFQNRARCRPNFELHTHLLDMANLLCSIGELPLTLRARYKIYYVGRSATPTSSVAILVISAPEPRPRSSELGKVLYEVNGFC